MKKFLILILFGAIVSCNWNLTKPKSDEPISCLILKSEHSYSLLKGDTNLVDYSTYFENSKLTSSNAKIIEENGEIAKVIPLSDSLVVLNVIDSISKNTHYSQSFRVIPTEAQKELAEIPIYENPNCSFIVSARGSTKLWKNKINRLYLSGGPEDFSETEIIVENGELISKESRSEILVIPSGTSCKITLITPSKKKSFKFIVFE